MENKKVGIYIDNELIGETTPVEPTEENAFYAEGTFLGLINGSIVFDTDLGRVEVLASELPEELKNIEIGTKLNLKWG